eukprot:scaffold270_cov390-Prasinococcus_capsulatus_cf.AAC.18
MAAARSQQAWRRACLSVLLPTLLRGTTLRPRPADQTLPSLNCPGWARSTAQRRQLLSERGPSSGVRASYT